VHSSKAFEKNIRLQKGGGSEKGIVKGKEEKTTWDYTRLTISTGLKEGGGQRILKGGDVKKEGLLGER